MRKETRKYLCSELLRYQHSLDELRIIRRKIAVIQKRQSAYNPELEYLLTRKRMLETITNGINDVCHELDDDLLNLAKLKFFAHKPRLSDYEIMQNIACSKSNYYYKIAKICSMLAKRIGMDI